MGASTWFLSICDKEPLGPLATVLPLLQCKAIASLSHPVRLLPRAKGNLIDGPGLFPAPLTSPNLPLALLLCLTLRDYELHRSALRYSTSLAISLVQHSLKLLVLTRLCSQRSHYRQTLCI